VALLVAVSAAPAQETQNPATPHRAAQQKPPAQKHKVWTDDDLSPLRPVASKQSQDKGTRGADSSPSTTSTKPPEPSEPTKPFARAALSNPKSGSEADKMIAWETRDIEAQQEFVEKLKQQLGSAPADQKQHIEQLLQERIQILADLHKELKSLIAQKEGLGKKAAGEGAPSNAAPSQDQ